jgi:hypothetical protein
VLTTLDYFKCLRAHTLSLSLSFMASSPWRSIADSAVALHDSQSSIFRSVGVYRETAADFFGFLRILLDMHMVVATATTRRSRKTTCLQMQVLSYLALLAKTAPRMFPQSKRRYKLLPLSCWTSSFTKPEHRMHVCRCNGKQRSSIKFNGANVHRCTQTKQKTSYTRVMHSDFFSCQFALRHFQEALRKLQYSGDGQIVATGNDDTRKNVSKNTGNALI